MIEFKNVAVVTVPGSPESWNVMAISLDDSLSKLFSSGYADIEFRIIYPHTKETATSDIRFKAHFVYKEALAMNENLTAYDTWNNRLCVIQSISCRGRNILSDVKKKTLEVIQYAFTKYKERIRQIHQRVLCDPKTLIIGENLSQSCFDYHIVLQNSTFALSNTGGWSVRITLLVAKEINVELLIIFNSTTRSFSVMYHDVLLERIVHPDTAWLNLIPEICKLTSRKLGDIMKLMFLEESCTLT